jgi:hypothetical protein
MRWAWWCTHVTRNASTRENEGGSRVKGQPGLQIETLS